jgi:tetratricopeptide (TPR) repeat protein
MSTEQFQSLVREGLEAMNDDDTLLALMLFEDAARIRKPPLVRSCLAYCLAREKQLYSKAIAMCQSAKQDNPENSLHYLNLGRIYLMAGHKRSAMITFRQGLKMERNPRIVAELKELGVRRPPPLPRFSREHPFNRLLGKCLAISLLR